MNRSEIYEAIDNERARQDAKFPGQWGGFATAFAVFDEPTARCSAFECAAILAEEAGEVARAVIDRDRQGLEHELVQVAAVCVAWLEAHS